jgi:patatin-like phospholipase/acyl hydrolase
VKKKILAIDGGGVRGIIPAILLSDLERRLGQPIHESFDLIVGTSTGGILALHLALGRLAFTAVDLYRCEAANIFRRPSRRLIDWHGIFRPKYDATGLEQSMRTHFEAHELKSAKVPCAVTAAQVDNMGHVIIRSWERPKTSVVEAALATSAAPTYFPATDSGEIDGGVWANNPSIVAMYLAHELWGWEPVRILSLGTGHKAEYVLPRKAKNMGTLCMAASGLLSRVLMGAGEDFFEKFPAQVLQQNYLRVQTDLEAVDSAMDRSDDQHLADLQHLANRVAFDRGAQIADFVRAK